MVALEPVIAVDAHDLAVAARVDERGIPKRSLRPCSDQHRHTGTVELGLAARGARAATRGGRRLQWERQAQHPDRTGLDRRPAGHPSARGASAGDEPQAVRGRAGAVQRCPPPRSRPRRAAAPAPATGARRPGRAARPARPPSRRASAARAAVRMSGASTPPPAPWPSITTPVGRPSGIVDAGARVALGRADRQRGGAHVPAAGVGRWTCSRARTPAAKGSAAGDRLPLIGAFALPVTLERDHLLDPARPVQCTAS